MKDKTSVCRHKRRRRSPSSASPDNRKHELSDLENNPSKEGRGKYRRKLSPVISSQRSSDSESEHDVEENVERGRKRHINPKSYDSRNSGSEEENCTEKKSKSSHSRKTDDKYKFKNEDDAGRNRPREKEKTSRFNPKSEKQSSSDHARRRDRHNDDDDDDNDGHRRGGGSGSRNTGRRLDSASNDRRMHSNERHQERRNEDHNRRRHGEEFNSRNTNRQFHGGDERRKRWSDGGEGSRTSGSRGGNRTGDGDQLSSFDRNRPIKKEPGLNDDESENYEWGQSATGSSKARNNVKKEKDVDKDKPNFGLSGKLTEDTNTVNGVVIKYSEPPEARKPRRRWRLYVFKGEENLPTLYLHRQSAFLIGRDRKVVDIPVDHPSCSKQHAAFQFRLVPYERPNGTMGKRVRPYIIDLESSNGTFVNNNRIDSKKYVELLERDVVKFGFSSREYVLLHEQSKESEGEDDDVVGE